MITSNRSQQDNARHLYYSSSFEKKSQNKRTIDNKLNGNETEYLQQSEPRSYISITSSNYMKRWASIHNTLQLII